MGARNPDRIPIAQRWRQGRTVADMAAGGWDVISRCEACALAMQVDLKLVARVSGPDTSLWNRRARCRRLLCGGFVEFLGRAPGMDWHEPLRVDDRLPDPAAEPAWLRQQRRAAKTSKEQE